MARRGYPPEFRCRVKTSLKLSALPMGQTIGNFDFMFQPSVERSQIETLATCAWIREKASLLIQGPPGIGKTHLAIALGVRAIENGFSVAFLRLEGLMAAMKRDANLSPQRLCRRKYMNVALLVIDEVGFEPMDRQEVGLFFRMVSYRYGRGSILITTNKGIRDWPKFLAGDEVLATAILDRLLQHSYVLNIKGRSYRLRVRCVRPVAGYLVRLLARFLEIVRPAKIHQHSFSTGRDQADRGPDPKVTVFDWWTWHLDRIGLAGL